MQTEFLTYKEQLDLVDKGLATVSINGAYSTFKYHRKVMYSYLWNKHPEARACRGHTYNSNTGKIITCPPMKSFNYLENRWWSDVPLDTKVIAYKKYNGFMAAVSVDDYDNVVVSTTGSTKSEYAQWAKGAIGHTGIPPIKGETHLYEIILPQDPHIVKEDKTGAVLLGFTVAGKFAPWGIMTSKTGTLAEIIELSKADKGEGFMVYKVGENGQILDGNNPCKLKTPYYTGKKTLMRANFGRVNSMYNHTQQFIEHQIPEMFVPVVLAITNSYSMDEWVNTSEQGRRYIIEQFLGEDS
jgi:hypothetical protein